MNTHSWWNRYGSQMLLLGLAVLAAFFVRQTQGAALFELYYWVTKPFETITERLGQSPSPQPFEQPKIQELEARVQELESQNQNLQKLLNYVKSKPNDKGVVAPIIARSPDHWWEQVLLGQGSNEGIQENDLVMGPGGLVGRVSHVTPNTSKVLLVSDPNSRIGVAVSRTREMGFLRGKNDGEGVMEFFENIPTVKVGDIVVTSAFSQIVPAGWPIGKVISVEPNKAPAPEAVIEFFVPLGSVEWVVIYPNVKSSETKSRS
ncbi:MAG: rod shape-determining protein MreC [Microcoleaceae cyanobacterium]